MRPIAIFTAVLIMGGAALDQASNWWERAFATHLSSEMSPDGCIRVDTYRPFWLLPSPFHRMTHPDPSITVEFGLLWEDAIFKRAYEAGTGIFLGETVVFDPSATVNYTEWGDADRPGRRVIRADQFLLADTDRCSDLTTLARLKVERRKAWERDQQAFAEAIRRNKEEEAAEDALITNRAERSVQ